MWYAGVLLRYLQSSVGCTVTMCRSADCSHTIRQLTTCSATRGVPMYVVYYIHTQRRVHRASVGWQVEVPQVGVCSEVKLLTYIWEVLGSKLLTGSPANPMWFPSFSDFLHLKLGHGSFHPRLNLFSIHWHPRIWRCISSVQCFVK